MAVAGAPKRRAFVCSHTFACILWATVALMGLVSGCNCSQGSNGRPDGPEMRIAQGAPPDFKRKDEMERAIRILACRAKGNARERVAVARDIGEYTLYGLIMTEQVLDILLDLLRDEEVTVRRESAKVLQVTAVRSIHSMERRNQIFGPLRHAAEHDPDPEVRRCAGKAVNDIREIDKIGWGGGNWG